MPIGTTAAILGGVALAGTAAQAITGSNAADSAADAQIQGSQQAAQVQREGLAQQQRQFDTSRQDAINLYTQNRADARELYDTGRSDTQPFRSIGYNALLALSDSMGLARPAGYESRDIGNAAFRTDPGYKFAFDEGLKGVDARFRGQSRSGAKMKALNVYGQGVADQQYGNWLARLSGLASVGQTATGQAASLASNFASSNNSAAQGLTNNLTNIGANNANAIGSYAANTGNLLENAAAARASGYVGSSNATGSAISGGVNNLASLYGMGAFGGSSGGSNNWLSAWMGST